MTSKKPPPTPGDAPEPPSAPLDVFTEVLVTALGQVRGLQNQDVAKATTGVRDEIRTLLRSVEQKAKDPEVRDAAAADAEKLLELFTRTGAALGNALTGFGAPMMKVMQGVDMQKATDALRSLADWIKNPTPEGEAHMKKVVGELEATLGPKPGDEAQAREDAKRREEIRADVKASLDEIFRGKKKPI